MTHPRRSPRVRPTGQMNRSGKIAVGPRAPLIDCTIIDYSAGGACLEVGGQIDLPSRFELFWTSTKKKCRLVWKVGRRVGVAF
jgi:hypothetical protein